MPARGANAGGPIAVCYGTRPQVIKVSALAGASPAPARELLLVDTGQHYDYELNALLYEQLGVPRPHLFLGVGSGSHAAQTAAIISRAAEAFTEHRPRAVLVVGDTNSTLGCALAAVQMRIPVVHVEAGLRAADAMMAEEINRRVVDEISTLLCAPSAGAEAQLHREQVTGTVVLTGDVGYDVLRRYAPLAPAPHLAPSWPLEPGAPFAFATLHRAELVDRPATLAPVLAALGDVGLPVVFAMHPRTRAALERHALADAIPPRVSVLPPLGYLEAVGCIRDAEVVITDSGGVQREAYWLGTPCVTVRGETEWEETLASGGNVLVPPERAVAELPGVVGVRRRASGGGGWSRDAFGDGGAAQQVWRAVDELL